MDNREQIEQSVISASAYNGNDDRCFPIKRFYILNDDLTMTLIWKDGELVV
ncbi:putative phage PVL protein [Staphylococcus aureus]|nr:putative phage PVL protein [Staphylococcus aureus]